MRKKAELIASRAILVIALIAVGASPAFSADRYCRVELYFGFDRPSGPPVSETDWHGFVESEIATRFWEGFTVMEAIGQYRDSRGVAVREESRVVIIYYKKSERRERDAAIEEIRAAYRSKFQQESALRIDFVRSVRARF